MHNSPAHLPRRTFIAGAGIAAGFGTFVPNTRASASEQATNAGPMDTVTVTGAVAGVPFALSTGSLDELEYGRRAKINARVFRQAWETALSRLRIVTAAEKSSASGLSTVSQPIAGVVIRVPPGFYPIDAWNMSVTPADLGLPGPERDAGHQFGEWSVRIVIEADGAVLVAKDYADSGNVGTPVVYLGSPSSPGFSADLLKRVTIRGLSVQNDVDPTQAFTSSDRAGMVIHQAQEITLERVSIYGMRREGLRLEGVMDSTFLGVNIGWCARSGAAGSPFALSLITHRDSAGRQVENCNALRFIGCHVEFCNLELFIDRGSRHIDFLDSKFEHGWGTSSETSPVQVGVVMGGSDPHERVNEVSFVSCMFVQNSYAFEGSHASHVSIEEAGYVGSQSQNAKTAVSFVACHFTVPDGGGERWFTGADATFLSCDFNGCGNAEGELACFDLGNDVTLTACRFSVVRVIHDGINGDQGTGGGGAALRRTRADLFRFHGGASRIIDPVIYFPARTQEIGASPGTLAIVSRDAGNGNRISGWRTHWYGLPSGTNGEPGHIAVIRYDDPDRTQLLSTLIVEPWSSEVSEVLAPDARGAVSVAGREILKLRGGAQYSNFVDASAGQIVRVVTDGGTASIAAGNIVVRGSSPSVIGPGEMRSFVLYSDGAGVAWFEI